MFNRSGPSNNTSSSYSKVNTDDYSDENGNGEADEVLRSQQELMKQQDEGLDVLSASVLRLGEMSMGISEELGQQNMMLESMETDLDDAAENLDIVTRSTKLFIKQAGGEQNCKVIVILTIVALILFFLVLYG